MESFCNKLNVSPWRGVVTEVGIGLEFSSRYLRVPGASKTIQGVNCPYIDSGRPHDMRAVSLENAKRLAEQALAQTSININDNPEHLFGLAITGAHYPNRDSHAWVYIATPKWNAWMHFSIAANADREWVGRIVSDRVQWLMEGCMLSNDTWRGYIENISDSLETHNIDVLYAPGVSDFERMLLLRPNNPLGFKNGKFCRVVDLLRQYQSIYPGSFNPPTRCHLQCSELFEITQTHDHKPGASIEDMLHRVQMLSMSGKDVLITQAPKFIDKYKLIQKRNENSDISFILGADTWNCLVSQHQYPYNKWLSEQMPKAEFLIAKRRGFAPCINGVANYMKHSIWELPLQEFSSTAVREAEVPAGHEYLTPEVSDYIRKQELYNHEDQN